MAYSIVSADPSAIGGLRLLVDFSQPVDVATLQPSDLALDSTLTASSINVLDADSVEFLLPDLSAGPHSVVFLAGVIKDALGADLEAFTRTFHVAEGAQFVIQQNPRLQLGNAPLFNYPGGNLDRVELLWQTMPAATPGVEDSFTIEYRAAGSDSPWQAQGESAAIDTGVEGRIIRSATITGLNWNTDYEYRVRHRSADVIVGQYQSAFHTRLQPRDATPFSFAAYGDSASGPPSAGFLNVQSQINKSSAAFAVLLGDNVYDTGTHAEWDLRFNAALNPPAAAWTAGHIDYLGVGNHDIEADGLGLAMEHLYAVPIPVAGVTAPAEPLAPGERPEHNYSFDYGDVHFVTFDSNSWNEGNLSRLDALLDWVEADLAASTATWKIVYGHHPLAGASDRSVHHPGTVYYQEVVRRLTGAGVDLFMSGHSHTYGWSYPLTGETGGVADYVDRGAYDYFFADDGLPTLISGAGGRELTNATFSDFMAAGYSASTDPRARDGFSLVEVTPGELTIKYVAADNGAVMDQFTISKAPPAITARPDSVTTVKSTPRTLAPLANDILFSGAPTILAAGGAAHGGVTIHASSQTLTYTPEPGYFGNDSFSYTVQDASGSSTATVEVDVTGPLATFVFQQGSGDYDGTIDTFVASDDPEAIHAAASSLTIDSSPVKQALLRFEDLFGSNPGQVPRDATQVSASLTVFVNDEGSSVSLHRMLIPWSDTATFMSTGGGTNGFNAAPGLQVDGVEAKTEPDITTVPLSAEDNYYTFDVSASVQAWLADPVANPNYGWAIFADSAIGSGFVSADGTTPAERPRLTIRFPIEGNLAPSAAGDSISTHRGIPINIAVLANDQDLNEDPLTVSALGSPAHGTVVLNSDQSITYHPVAGYLGSDSFTYTASDGNGGLAQALVTVTMVTPVSIPAAYLSVAQHNSSDTAASVSITPLASGQATAELAIVAASSSRGDYAVRIGSTAADDMASGTLITSVSQNGRTYPAGDPSAGLKYATSSVYTSGGGYVVSTSVVPSGTHAEANQNVSAAYFSSDHFRMGTMTTAAGSTPTLLAAAAVAGGGAPITPVTDGVLLVTSMDDGNSFAATTPTAAGWEITRHRVSDNGNLHVAGEVAWVYVPYATPTATAIAGRVRANATAVTGVPLVTASPGSGVTVARTGAGTYMLSIARHSPATGVLLIGAENDDNASDNLVNFQALGNSWVIESRDLPSANAAADPGTTSMGLFSFVFIPTIPLAAAPPVNTLDITDDGILTYTGGAALPNLLSVTEADGAITITDDQAITLTATAAALFTGSGTNTITGPLSAITSVSLDTGDAHDVVTLGALSKPISVRGGGQLGDQLVLSGDIMVAGDVAFTGFGGGIIQAAGTLLTATNVTLDGGAIGTAASPLRTTAATIMATGGGGGVYITETDDVSITASATGAGDMQIQNLAGALTVASTSFTATGNLSLTSPDAIHVDAALNAGSGTITISANADGMGSEGYSQGAAGVLTTTNTTSSALRLTVNTPSGGDGNAIVGAANIGTALGGDYAIDTYGGSILWQTALGVYTLPATGAGSPYAPAALITAFNLHFTTSPLAATSIGTLNAPLQVNGSGQSRTAWLNAGAGGIYISDSTTTANSWLNIAEAIATDSGDIVIIANGGSERAVTITGTVTTGSGSIRLLADDDLNIFTNGLIGGPGFAGTVRLQANLDGSSRQFFNMAGNASIVTANTSENAVSIEQATRAADTNAQLQNITVGAGGTIIVNVTNVGGGTALGPAANLGGILHSPTGLLNAGPNGKILLVARANDIGKSGAPMNIGSGTVAATTSAGGTVHLGSNDVLRVAAVNADSGSVQLTGAAGVVVNGVLGDASTTGPIHVAATTGAVVFNSSPYPTALTTLHVDSGASTEAIAGPLLSPSLTLGDDTAWTVSLAGTSADEFTQVSVTGTLTLNDPALHIELAGYTPNGSDDFVVFLNDGTDAVAGNGFLGLAEGEEFVAADALWKISYVGGDGNDVVVTGLPILNKAPSSISLSSNVVAENHAGAVIGVILAIDPDESDLHTFSVNDGRFEVEGKSLRLKPGISLDFEAGASITLEVTATDNGWPPRSLIQSVTVVVTDMNDAPSVTRLSRTGVFAEIAGAWIATVSSEDPDGDSHSLVVDDDRFEIRGGELYLKADQSLQLQAEPTVLITLTASDALGASLSREFSLTVEPRPLDWEHGFQWRPLPTDVNADGVVSPLDAVLIINRLNVGSQFPLPIPPGGTAAPLFYDVSGDDVISPLDALLVINYLNALGAAGQGEAASDIAKLIQPLRQLVQEPTGPQQTPLQGEFQSLQLEESQVSPLLQFQLEPADLRHLVVNTVFATSGAEADDFWLCLWEVERGVGRRVPGELG